MMFRRALLLVLLFFTPISCHARRGEQSPYEVLGVSRDASQDEIRKRYKKLCLKLHPDKNVHLSSKQRERCEEMFKKVQHANAQIGDEASRKRYDLASSSPFSGSYGAGSTQGMDRAVAEAFYRSFANMQRRSSGRTPFYVNGVDIAELFSGAGTNRKAAFWNPQSLKSIYVQKVQVPLQDLYSGKTNVEFVLKDTIWKRYRAAFRGGVGVSILYQGAVLAIPLLRVSWIFSALAGTALFHTNLPRPTKILYDVNIQRGWKGGTKLTFEEVEPGFDVVFILEEQKHGRYYREGNDLHTSVSIRKKQAKEGCIVEIEPLGAYDAPILIRLKPNQVTHSGQQVTLKGKGWPLRQGGHGDLIITVNLVNRSMGAARRRATTKRTRSI